MSRVPPPNTGSDSLSPCGDALRLFTVFLEAEVENFGAAHRRPHRRVGVQADEEIRLVVVGERRALVEPDGLIAVARQDHPRAESRLERGLQPPRDASVTAFSSVPCVSVRAVFLPP